MTELTEKSDAELMTALIGGDRRALGSLYDRHAGVMLALGIRILRVRPDAMDVLHDVFLEAWEHATIYERARGTVRTWLLLRMRSRAIDRRRRSARTATLSVAAESVVEESEWPTPDVDAVRSALLSLPASSQLLLNLAFFEGQSSTQIAALLACPVGTVKSRLRAAVCSLRELFRSPERQRARSSA